MHTTHRYMHKYTDISTCTYDEILQFSLFMAK